MINFLESKSKQVIYLANFAFSEAHKFCRQITNLFSSATLFLEGS